MLSKNIDYTIVGHNFFSYLLGIGLHSKNKKVLILDDDRFNHGELFTDSLTIMDLEILKKWGEKYDVPPLKKMEEYIQFVPLSFFVGKKEIILGDNPSRNFTELARKFPDFFSTSDLTDSFDQGLFQIAGSLADSFYIDKDLIKLSKRLEPFKQLEIMKKFEEFFQLFFQKENWDMMKQNELNSLISLTRGFFHNCLNITGTRSELIHLFFSLLSPHFKFDHSRLVADLLEHFKTIGGEFKKINVSSFKFQKGILSSFESDTFEGLINPKQLIFIGGELVGLPITLKEKVTAFNALTVKIQLKHNIPSHLKNKRILFSSPLKTGTNWPFWEAHFFTDSIIFNIAMIKRQGIKENFIENKVIDYLQEDLHFLFPEYEFIFDSYQSNFTSDVIVERQDFQAHKKSSPSTSLKPVTVFSKETPFSFFRLKNVSYLGPYSGNTHGVFSSLIQLQKRIER